MSEFAFFRFLSNDLLTEEEKAPENKQEIANIAEERDERFHDRFPEAGEEGEEDDECNGNNNCSANDFGQRTAHENSSLNDKGVE
jgi:hypothetical protein